ncbi:MAG TPA: hypothetical protein VFK14_04820 [Solirubrobacterales bacterium]|nr:hypothetical protein [Solirubrobacterales bacterium]
MPAARGRGLLFGLGLLVCALVLLVSLVGSSDAAKAPKTKVILGKTAVEPDPSCPDLPCQAIGSVTGFQVDNGQTRLPFLVPHDGTIKSWTLTLAQPTNSQRTFFNGFFGTPPEARLSILRRIPGTQPPRYALRRQGSVKVLSPYLGQTVEFGANLKVEKGDIVALSVPTWAPAFAQELPVNNVWRASREPGTCKNATDIRQGEPQQKPGRRATYGCKYTTARLLYTATLVEGR